MTPGQDAAKRVEDVLMEHAQAIHETLASWAEIETIVREHVAAALAQARSEQREACAEVVRAVGFKHAETVDKSHTRRLVRRGVEKIITALRRTPDAPDGSPEEGER